MLEGYEISNNGAIRQTRIGELMRYDREYIAQRYIPIAEKCREMASLRLGVLCGALGFDPSHLNILDVGYGSGEFLAAAKNVFASAHGHDITGINPPEGVTFEENIFADKFDVVTFFDVLEHFQEPSVIQHLRCSFVMISLPWCHYKSDEWFRDWKHRRPDEHLWHFDSAALVESMQDWGFAPITQPMSIEDSIRGWLDGSANILTMVFRKCGR